MSDRTTLLLSGLALAGLGTVAYATSRKRDDKNENKNKNTPTRARLGSAASRKTRRIGTGSYWSQIGSTSQYDTDDDIETLARVITSEASSQRLVEQHAIAWVARNKAIKRNTNLAKFLGPPFGKQGSRMANGKRRTFSTRQAATPASRDIAAQVLSAAQAQDPTRGATSAFEPALQDRLFKTNRYRRDATMLRAEWRRGGADRVGRIGRWELWAQRTS